MQRVRFVFLIFTVLILAGAGCAGKESAEPRSARGDVLYYCACGDTCACNSVATEPGDCTCGKAMQWGHVVKIEGNEALVCTCHEGCVCVLGPNSPGKCGCGKEVRRINLEKTGLYFCNCGGACTCNIVADQPGQCRCGMVLKKES